jgi:hypothetical protein
MKKCTYLVLSMVFFLLIHVKYDEWLPFKLGFRSRLYWIR